MGGGSDSVSDFIILVPEKKQHQIFFRCEALCASYNEFYFHGFIVSLFFCFIVFAGHPPKLKPQMRRVVNLCGILPKIQGRGSGQHHPALYPTHCFLETTIKFSHSILYSPQHRLFVQRGNPEDAFRPSSKSTIPKKDGKMAGHFVSLLN